MSARVVSFPPRQNTVAVLPNKNGFEVAIVPPAGEWTSHGVFRTLSEAKAWAEVQAFRLDCRVRVVDGRGCA